MVEKGDSKRARDRSNFSILAESGRRHTPEKGASTNDGNEPRTKSAKSNILYPERARRRMMFGSNRGPTERNA